MHAASLLIHFLYFTTILEIFFECIITFRFYQFGPCYDPRTSASNGVGRSLLNYLDTLLVHIIQNHFNTHTDTGSRIIGCLNLKNIMANYSLPYRTYNILFIISSLSAGGAERVLASIANGLTAKNHNISILTIDTADNDFYTLSTSIFRIGLGQMNVSTNVYRAVYNNFKRIIKLRNSIYDINPDLIVSFLDKTNILSLLASFGGNRDLLIMEHTNPDNHHIGAFWEFFRFLLYPFSNRLGFLTDRALSWASKLKRKDSLFRLSNPININISCHNTFPHSSHLLSSHNSVISLCAMGRLSHEKGLDLLIKSFYLVLQSYPNANLIIIGDGSEKAALSELSISLNISSSVFFLGRLKEPFKILKQCDIFILSSRYEGFPMALCEAMSCGLPVVSFDCPTGPREIVRNGVDGILVPANNINALSFAIIDLIKNPIKRYSLGQNALGIQKRFSSARIFAKWENLLSEIT